MKNKALVFGLIICALMPAVHSYAQPQNQNRNQVAAQEVEFFTLVEDMPLMPGLSELVDETTSFDKPEGRIIEAFAAIESGVTPAQISAYYKVTLPQFGWGAVKNDVFFRRKEHLELHFIKRGGQDFMQVTVRPSH